MWTKTKKAPLRQLTRALLCTTALSLPSQVLAETFLIDEDFLGSLVTNNTNGGANLTTGDELIIDEAITIDVDEAEGLIVLFADDVVITNNGTIITRGSLTDGSNVFSSAGGLGYGDGLYAEGANRLLYTNNGIVSIGDTGTYGAYIVNSEAVRLINNGLIEIREEAAVVYTQGDPPVTGLTAVASGGFRVNAFEVIENSAEQIIDMVEKGGHVLLNNGLILSDVLQTRGMYIDGAYFSEDVNGNDRDSWVRVSSLMINNGQIIMQSDDPSNGTLDVSGMRIEGHEGQILNAGIIFVGAKDANSSAPQGFGIDINGAGGSIVNTGTIIVQGDDSHGIEHYRNETGTTVRDASTGAVIANETFSYDGDIRSGTANLGTIIVTGEGSHGVSLNAIQKHDFLNAGTIIALNGFSIDIGATTGFDTPDGENNILLQDGSVLYGDIAIKLREVFNRSTQTLSREGSTHLTNFGMDDGLNASIRFNLDRTAVSRPDRIVTNGNGMPDEENVVSFHNSHVYDAETGMIYVADLDSYAQQDKAFFFTTTQIQDAVDLNTAGPAENPDAATTWFEVFGGALDGEGQDAAPSYDATAVGALAGRDLGTFGIHGGVALTNVEGNEKVSYDTETFTVFAGITGQLPQGPEWSLTGGVAFNETTREVADNRVTGGIDEADTDYRSAYLSPSIRFAGPLEGSSVRLRYTGLWQEEHDFFFPGGTVLEVDSRFVHAVDARFEMSQSIDMGLVNFGVDAAWIEGQDMDFDLMGAGRTTPYDDGFYSRAFAGLQVGPARFQVGYDTEERATFGVNVSF